MALTLNRVTEADIQRTAANDNEDAITAICELAGIGTGDVAAQAFSGFGWGTASVAERAGQIEYWLKLEAMYDAP